MDSATVQSLVASVRGGAGLKAAIRAVGLPVKETLRALRDGSHKSEFKQAKRDYTSEKRK